MRANRAIERRRFASTGIGENGISGANAGVGYSALVIGTIRGAMRGCPFVGVVTQGSSGETSPRIAWAKPNQVVTPAAVMWYVPLTSVGHGAYAFVSRLSLENRCRGPRDFATPGRCSKLVVYDSQFFALRGQAQDGQEKISAPCGVDPSRAEYQVRHAGITNGLLAGELRPAIDASGIGLIVFFVGGVFNPSKT